jgi:hypothetical protein
MGQVNEKYLNFHSNSRIESENSFSYSREEFFPNEIFFNSRDFIDPDDVNNSNFIGNSPINYDNSADINEKEENASIDQQYNLMNEIETRNNHSLSLSLETPFISQETTSQNNSNKEKNHLGRKRKEEKANQSEGSFHDMYVKDNISIKIQRHFLNFIIALLNSIFPIFNYNQKLYKLDNAYKINLKKNNVESLKDQTIEYIISNKISEKYKTINDKAEANRKICEEIKNYKVLKKILSENYLVFFKKFYYKSNSSINLKDYDFDIDITLTKDAKNFKHLLKENEKKGSQYIWSIK